MFIDTELCLIEPGGVLLIDFVHSFPRGDLTLDFVADLGFQVHSLQSHCSAHGLGPRGFTGCSGETTGRPSGWWGTWTWAASASLGSASSGTSGTSVQIVRHTKRK